MLDNVWVVETAQDLDLSFHLLEDALHPNLTLVKNLDGYLVVSDFIDGDYKRYTISLITENADANMQWPISQ